MGMIANCLMESITRHMIEKGSLAHNACYLMKRYQGLRSWIATRAKEKGGWKEPLRGIEAEDSKQNIPLTRPYWNEYPSLEGN